MEIWERDLEELMEGILDNNDKIKELQAEVEDMKHKAMKIMEGNFILDKTHSDGTCKIMLMNYTKDLVNKEKVQDLICDLKQGKKDVEEIDVVKDTTKESKIKFVTVRYIED